MITKIKWDDQIHLLSPAQLKNVLSFSLNSDLMTRHSKEKSQTLAGFLQVLNSDRQVSSRRHSENADEHCLDMHCSNGCAAKGVVRQLFFWAHLATSMAAWLPLLGRQNSQQDGLVPHFFWQSWRAGMHLGSFWQAAHSLGHFKEKNRSKENWKGKEKWKKTNK